jgi:hypothetical protein
MNPRGKPIQIPVLQNPEGGPHNVPIQVGPVLQCLLDHSDYFGPRDPHEIINPSHYYLDSLMDSLPHAHNGLMLRDTMYELLSIYVKNNSLKHRQTFTPDPIMKQCFDGNIPAQYIVNRKRISMVDAVNRGLIRYPLNTFDALKHINPNFDPQNVTLGDVLTIVQLNANRAYPDPNIIHELVSEYLIVRSTLDQWNELLNGKDEGLFSSGAEVLFDNYMTGVRNPR